MLRLLLVVFVFSICVSGCSSRSGGSLSNEDAYIVRQLSNTPHKQEALSWLQQTDGKERTVGDGDLDEPASLQMVKDLYQRGAVHVTAIDIDADTHMETTRTLIVEMPQQETARKRLLQIEAKVAAIGGFDPVTDQGQQYLMLHW